MRVVNRTGGEPVAAHVQAMVDAPNPEYAIHEIVNLVPFQTAVEKLGATAGRLYLREQNTLTAATMSMSSLRQLRDQIDEVLP